MSVRRTRPAEPATDAGVERARRHLERWTAGGPYDRERSHSGGPDCFACLVEARVARWREIVAGTGGGVGDGEPTPAPAPRPRRFTHEEEPLR